MPVAIPGSRLGARALAVTRRFFPALEEELVGGMAGMAYSEVIDTQRVLTGTLKASTTLHPSSPGGRGLEYGTGHEPIPTAAMVDQAMAAREFGEPIILSEDARSPEGFPYGVIIEGRFRTFAKAEDAARSAAPGIAARAGAKAIREALR